VADKNDPFVDQFLDQGFTVLGKTRLPEFGFNGSTEFQNEEPVRNPWHTAYTAGGSSGGAAALVASGALPIAHGNDGGGSIRIPAAASGLVGLKSTRGRLVKSLASRSLPVNLISEGVLTRTVRDTARFLAEAERYHQPRRLPPVGLVEGPGSKRLKVGVVLDSITGIPTDEETRETVEATARALQHLGHGVEEMPAPVPQRFIEDFKTYYGFMAFMMSRFGHRMMAPDFDPEKLDGLTKGLAAYYAERKRKTPAVMTILQLSRFYYARALRDFDVIISPVLGHTVPELGWLNPNVPFETLFERLIQYASFTPANNASGGPAISLPMGLSRAGTPIGVQVSAAHGNERTLLELAFALEQDPGWQNLSSK
jgi:amidase